MAAASDDKIASAIGFVDRVGAVAILALLIWQSPKIFAVTNQGKIELAKVMKEAQSESYGKYLDMVSLNNKEFNLRVISIATELKELCISNEKTANAVADLTKIIHELVGKIK